MTTTSCGTPVGCCPSLVASTVKGQTWMWNRVHERAVVRDRQLINRAAPDLMVVAVGVERQPVDRGSHPALHRACLPAVGSDPQREEAGPHRSDENV
jgi:hypothetical protein